MGCTGSIKNFSFQHNNEMFVIDIHFALNSLIPFRKEKMFIFPEPKHKLMQTFSQMQKKKTLKIHKTNDDNVQFFLPFPIFVVVAASVQSNAGAHSFPGFAFLL